MKILFSLFFLVYFLHAHQSGLSYLEIVQQKEGSLDVTYKKPLSDTRVMDIQILFPKVCIRTSAPLVTIHNGFTIKKFTLACKTKDLINKRIWVHGLVRSDRGVLVHYKGEDFVKKALLNAVSPFVLIDKKANYWHLARQYVKLGIFHILTGFDHLMFVMLLFFLAKNLKQLLYTVTFFTLAHSITLACGILGIVYIPPPLVESMIALSIILLAKELLIPKESFTKRHLEITAFSFGLLHGFGFSSALREIGLPQDDIPLSLFFFNVGIELGQILFIAVLGGLVFACNKFGCSFKRVYPFIAYIVGIVATFWFIQRVLLF